jgi:hypothetical protein
MREPKPNATVSLYLPYTLVNRADVLAGAGFANENVSSFEPMAITGGRG